MSATREARTFAYGLMFNRLRQSLSNFQQMWTTTWVVTSLAYRSAIITVSLAVNSMQLPFSLQTKKIIVKVFINLFFLYLPV
jgi:hypothetical protein